MELHIVGTIFARLEPARARFSAAARLSLVHQRAAHFTLLGHARHLPTKRVRARTGHVVHLQATPRLFDGRTDVAVTAHFRESTVVAREGCPRQFDILVRRLHRVRLIHLFHLFRKIPLTKLSLDRVSSPHYTSSSKLKSPWHCKKRDTPTHSVSASQLFIFIFSRFSPPHPPSSSH